MLLDLDELPGMDRSMALFKWNRWGWFSFQDCDHGPVGRTVALKAWLDGLLAEAGIVANGPRRVLCYPRVLGYVFNPLSVWFCHGEDGLLKALIYEVHNTYEERHAYVFGCDGAAKLTRHDCAKDFYVSPFLSADCRYHFRTSPPAGRVAVTILEEEEGAATLNATFAGTRRTLSDGALLAMFFSYPLMTLKVVAAIHFEALRLMLKGIRRHPHRPLACHENGPG